MLDGVVASLVGGLSDAFESRVTAFVSDIKTAIGGPATRGGDGDEPDTGRSRPLAHQSEPGAHSDRVDVRTRPADAAVGLQSQRAD